MMVPFKVLDLFSGIGGFCLGLEAAGRFETVAFCEINPFSKNVLAKHWPNVRQYSDVRNVNARTLQRDGIAIDVICGGFPCQDISFAGDGAGLQGERSGLWFEYLRLICELRPKYVIVENVAALVDRGLDVVLGGLAEIGYDAEWYCIPASFIGAPHKRDRIWIIAYPCGSRTERLVQSLDIGQIGPRGWCGKEDLFSFDPFQPTDNWPKPLLRGMDDGVSNRAHRLTAIGNAIVPQIAEIIGRSIINAENNN